MTDRQRAEAAQNHDINDDECRKHNEPLYSGWCKECAAVAITQARLEETYKAGTLQGIAYSARVDADEYREQLTKLRIACHEEITLLKNHDTQQAREIAEQREMLMHIYENARGHGDSIHAVTRWEIDTVDYQALEDFLFPKTPVEAVSYLSSRHATTCTCIDCRIARKSAAFSAPVIRDPNFDYDDVSSNARREEDD